MADGAFSKLGQSLQKRMPKRQRGLQHACGVPMHGTPGYVAAAFCSSPWGLSEALPGEKAGATGGSCKKRSFSSRLWCLQSRRFLTLLFFLSSGLARSLCSTSPVQGSEPHGLSSAASQPWFITREVSWALCAETHCVRVLQALAVAGDHIGYSQGSV